MDLRKAGKITDVRFMPMHHYSKPIEVTVVRGSPNVTTVVNVQGTYNVFFILRVTRTSKHGVKTISYELRQWVTANLRTDLVHTKALDGSSPTPRGPAYINVGSIVEPIKSAVSLFKCWKKRYKFISQVSMIHGEVDDIRIFKGTI